MSNPLWHYTDAARQQQGPVDEAGLATLWREGRINAQTLVWREGQAQWLPLGQLAAAMPWQNAGTGAAPPGLPNAARFGTLSDRPVIVKPANSGIGCGMIVLIVAVLMIPVLGILAAIAIPAYHDYTQRARLSGAIAAAGPLKLRLAESVASGSCPDAQVIPAAEHDAQFSSAWIGTFENGQCGIELVLADQPALTKYAGKKIWFWREDGQTNWKCSSEIENRFLPTSCRD